MTTNDFPMPTPDPRPLIAITMGDPSGCGPEVIARALLEQPNLSIRPLVIGTAAAMQWALACTGLTGKINPVTAPQQAASYNNGTINVLETGAVKFDSILPGKVQPEAGRAAYEYIIRGIDLAKAGLVAAVVTAPIHKEAVNLAGFHFDGHTEIFAQRTNTAKVTMMLASGHFRVTHVSTHCSLRTAIERCKTPRILEVIRITHQGLKQMGIADPLIALAGLNPHCGEGGLFGSEESEQIQPAIEQANAEGIRCYPRPVAPDTVFVRMAQFKEFDAVIANYHDQGHIAAKIVDFWGGVNITLGLPIIRTSVDHGTAFDVVGTGKANPKSMVNAIQYAEVMARHRLSNA
jgi:4-hydroxythreonine-4-phosphate dehydrogenase